MSETEFAVNWKSLQESPLALVPSLGRRSGAKGYLLYKPGVLTVSSQSLGLEGAINFYHNRAPSVRLFTLQLIIR